MAKYEELFTQHSEHDTLQEGVAEKSGSAALRGSGIEEPTSLPPARTSDRDGYWKKPTQAQIDNAAKYGFDLSKQSKY